MTFHEILKVHPQPTDLYGEALLRCIDSCVESAASCTSCADASLAESDLNELVRTVRLCLDCADVCTTTARVLTRLTTGDLRVINSIVQACAAACLACAEECERHASHHQHCRLCAETCRSCIKACDELLTMLGSSSTNAGT